jgi:RNA polymerase-binding protein DksA
MAGELGEQEIEQVRRRLEQRRADLSAHIRENLHDTDDERYLQVAHDVGDMEDHALAQLQVDANLATIHREIEEFRAVQAALIRVGQGTYGRCIDCGETIAAPRLEAQPTASRCLACAEAHERTQAASHPTL